MKKMKFFIPILLLIFMISFESKAAAPTIEFSHNFVKDGWNTEPFTITVTDPGIDKAVPDSKGTILCYYREITNSSDWKVFFGSSDNNASFTCGPSIGSGEITLLIWTEDTSIGGSVSDVNYVTYKYDDSVPSVRGYLSDGVININAEDYGSGVEYYGISTSKDVYPTEWSTSNKFTPTNGSYYLFAKDYAGNIGVSYNPVKSMTTLDKCRINITDEYSYTGEEIIPDFYVYEGEHPLMKDRDYTFSVSNNINAGNATITVTGKGNYTGTLTKDFTINKAEQVINDGTITTMVSAMRHPYITLKNDFKVTFGDGKMSFKSSDEKVFRIKSGKFIQKGPGIAYLTVIISETNNFKKTTCKYKVIVKPTYIAATKVTSPQKGQIKVQWLAPNEGWATGFQIQVSTSKKFTKKTTKTYTLKDKNREKYSKTIKGLKKGKKYYVRVRSYKKNKEGIVYSDYDDRQSIRVKK